MAYIRHRSRMVQESVFEDLSNTLIACRWMEGTTNRPVLSPADGTSKVITTTADDIFKLAEGYPVNLLDYFPTAQGEQQGPTPLNTFAMDNGRPGNAVPLELGTNILEQPYMFNFAFFAVSDAVADAVFSDLKDRYEGRIVANEAIALYDFNTAPDDVAQWMEIDSFQYARDLENVAPSEVHLFFAELAITDIVE